MEHNATLMGTTVEFLRLLLVTEQFQHDFAQEVGVDMERLSVQPDRVEMAWQFSTQKDGIPSLAKKLLPPTVNLTWDQEWTSQTAGGLLVRLTGTPSAKCTGEAQLLQAGDDVTYAVTTETKTNLPWPVGGRVESMINKDLVGWILRVQVRVAQRHIGT